MTNRVKLTLLCVALLTAISAKAYAAGGVATIHFYRVTQPEGSAMSPIISCDGVELVHLQNGSFFETQLPAGRHACRIRDGGDLSLQGWEFEAGRDYYIQIYFGRRWLLKRVSAEKGRGDLAKLTPVDKNMVVTPPPAVTK